MADESSSDELCESSDSFDVSSPEISTSSESISEEESVPQTSSRGKGKAKAKRAKTTDADACTGKRVAKRTPRTKKQSANSSLNGTEMDDLTSWIFSPEEATRVQEHLREMLLNDARIKDERKRFAEHLLCDAEKQNFQLLLSGFCRKFSTLAAESFKNNNPSYRKAGFSIAWVKFLSNFHPGKTTQERMILERILKNANAKFDALSVHGVVSVIHEKVYSLIHEHVRIKKVEASNTGTLDARTNLMEETDDVLYRYCGASLHRMITLREDTLAGKKGRGELSDKRKPIMEQEFEILRELLIKDKTNIPASLKTLDEGNLMFPRTELLPFLRSVDNEVREFATDSNLRKYPSKFLTMCQNAVLNNETLELDFRILVASIVEGKGASDLQIVNGLYQGLVSKLANTRINEFMNARMERELKNTGKSCRRGRDASTAFESLRFGDETQVKYFFVQPSIPITIL